MVKATFINLPQAKKEVVMQALLDEFSHYPLQEAQVARIVKAAQIARGAFYKYFKDLFDAYRYLYRIAMQEIHTNVKLSVQFNPQTFYSNVVNFVQEADVSRYGALIRLHVLYNESVLAQTAQSKQQLDLDPQNWSAMVLSHEAIRAILAVPQQKDKILARFKASLQLLQKGTN
ncbi:TetR/AcrR family transcriptional regulator [Lactobacillus sp. ESL0785]|uniref:TetR/AcrR family transcriptional regulator n=1 Tax=Lactobacillus sp. ESL0785 TaxID=2983232 RepID=UPI0023F8D789|nr:TetR/AcrR family transcriptional regulator [Lactobacillus sp. ESL0785]WEV71086.1 TetR/AcrR family transcriptional regulator [Lactobacillus sp. ESL0785]